MQSGERGPINIGNPCEFTIKELAEVIRGMVGSEACH
jgi:nucleoside-diphosphate-sugar epimerase